MRRFCTPGRIVVACKGCIYKSLFSSASSAAYCAAHDSIRRLGPRLRAHLVRVRKRAAEQHAHKRGLARTFKQNLGHAHLHGCADLMLMRDLCVDPHRVESVLACYERVCASRHARRRARTCTAHLWTRCYCVPATRRISSRKRFARWDSGTRVRYTYRAGPRVRIEILCRARLINTPATLLASLTSGGIEATSDET